MIRHHINTFHNAVHYPGLPSDFCYIPARQHGEIGGFVRSARGIAQASVDEQGRDEIADDPADHQPQCG